MASNYKQMSLAQQFAQDVVNYVRSTAGAAVITSAAVSTSGDDVLVTLNGATTNTAGAATVVFKNQLGSAQLFNDLPGFSGSGAQPQYTSGVCEFIFEAGPAAGGAPSTGYPTILGVISLLTRAGQRVEVYVSDDESAPTPANKGTVDAIVEPNVWWTVSGRV